VRVYAPFRAFALAAAIAAFRARGKEPRRTAASPARRMTAFINPPKAAIAEESPPPSAFRNAASAAVVA